MRFKFTLCVLLIACGSAPAADTRAAFLKMIDRPRVSLAPQVLPWAIAGVDVAPNISCSFTASTGTYNPHNQYIRPGGVVDPADSTGVHRMPPPGINGLQVYGSAPNAFKFKGSNVVFDVLPTSFQDNDPIRRACYGGSVKVLGKVGEDVCNIDGSLGLVIPLVDTDFISSLPDPSNAGKFLAQYPPLAQKCSGSFINGAAPNVFVCAPSNNFHPGECPNGDSNSGGQCALPIAAGFGQCNASNSTTYLGATRLAAQR